MPAIRGSGGSGFRRSTVRSGGALHLSFSGRQRVARAPARARAHSRRRAGQHHGRRGAGAVRLRQARSSRARACACGSTAPASMSATSRTASSLAICVHGKLARVAARHAVLACFNMVIPYIMPEVPPAQRAALAKNIKAPLVYTKVLVRNWHPWVKLGVHEITAPMSIYSRVKLDYPGEPRRLSACARSGRADVPAHGLRAGRARPRRAHAVHLRPLKAPGDGVCRFREGYSRAARPHAGRRADFPARATLRRSRSIAGRTATPIRRARCSIAISVRRWRRARQPIGRVAIANSDAGWDAYAHVAIDQADRAVRELLR